MILSNVNIGSGPGASDGESIYSAFNKVNQNFANVLANVSGLTNSVSSVAGRTGAVTLTIADVVGLNTTYASQANIITANTLMKGYVDGQITAANATSTTANVGIKGYIDLANTIQSAIITSSNSSMRAYVDGQITAANSAPNNANVGMIGYVDNKVSTANVGMIGYVDNKVSTANIGVIGYVDNKVSTANVGMIGYVDNKVSTANIGVIGYINLANTIQSSIINTSNTAIVGYVGLANTIQSEATLRSNIGMVGYVDNKVSTANIGMIGYVNNQVNAANVAWLANALSQSSLINTLHTAFVNLAANAEIQQGNIYSLENSIAIVANSISLGNTIQSAQITAANVGVIGYVDNKVSTANVGIKGYIDLANTTQQERITAANVGMIGYVGLANTIVSAGIVSANLGMKGYVDSVSNATTANIGMKGYVDLANTIQSAQITTANLGMKGYVDSVASQSIYGNANVASYLPSHSGNLTANSVDFNFLSVSDGPTGLNALSVGVPGISPFGNAIASFHGNINAPSHVSVHNKNSGSSSLSGFVATAYSSTFPEAYNATLQVTGEGWNVPAIALVKPYDAIVGSIGGNLNILAHDKDFSAPSKDIVFALGYNPTYEKVRISNSSVTITGANLTADQADFNFLSVSDGPTGLNALSVGVPGISPFGNAIASFHGNINAPSYINVHNKNDGGQNLSGFMATAYSSTSPEAYNATLQITSEGWSVPALTVVKPYDTIVGAIGGNLTILAHDKDFSAPSKDIVFALGYNPGYEKVRISNSSVTITAANLTISNSYVPSANTSVGTTGQITYDGNYVYICIATNTWRRANLVAW